MSTTTARTRAAGQLEALQNQIGQLLEGMGLDPAALPEPVALAFDHAQLEALLATPASTPTAVNR